MNFIPLVFGSKTFYSRKSIQFLIMILRAVIWYLFDNEGARGADNSIHKIQISIAYFFNFQLIELMAQLFSQYWSCFDVLQQ